MSAKIFCFQSAQSVKIAKLPKSANLLHKIAKSAALTVSIGDVRQETARRETREERQEAEEGKQRVRRRETGNGRREAGD